MSKLYESPRNIAFIVAAISAISLFTILYFGFVMPHDESKGKAILVSVVVFFVIFFLSIHFIKNFIYNRIKEVYNKVLGADLGKKSTNFAMLLGKDPLTEVNSNVEEWLNEHDQEIALLKKQENFRREFIGDVAHELKTPIFSVQGYVHTLLDGGLEDQTINRKFLLRTSKGIDRMISIVEDLDSITKLETGDVEMAFGVFSITQLVFDVIDTTEIRAREKNIKIIYNPKEEIMVLGDNEKIAQVLTNLIVNAVKYGRENGWVKIEMTQLGDTILTEVEDDGLGIEPQHLPRLFDRFYRVDKSRSREVGGSGLGLSIVKHILEAHNQKITVRSTPGKGSTFVFSLKKA